MKSFRSLSDQCNDICVAFKVCREIRQQLFTKNWNPGNSLISTDIKTFDINFGNIAIGLYSTHSSIRLSDHPSLFNVLPWAFYQILRIAGCACAGMPGTVSPPPWVSDSGMHHGACVTHVPCCMPGSLTNGFLWRRWQGKCSRYSRAYATGNLRIW